MDKIEPSEMMGYYQTYEMQDASLGGGGNVSFLVIQDLTINFHMGSILVSMKAMKSDAMSLRSQHRSSNESKVACDIHGDHD